MSGETAPLTVDQLGETGLSYCDTFQRPEGQCRFATRVRVATRIQGGRGFYRELITDVSADEDGKIHLDWSFYNTRFNVTRTPDGSVTQVPGPLPRDQIAYAPPVDVQQALQTRIEEMLTPFLQAGDGFNIDRIGKQQYLGTLGS